MFPNLHDRSHSESFLALITNRVSEPGLYVMDEPESALSFQGQLQLLRFIHDGLAEGSQFVIATHSPLLMRMPDATIYELGDHGICSRTYDDLAVVNLWRRFLTSPERVLDVLRSRLTHSNPSGQTSGQAPKRRQVRAAEPAAHVGSVLHMLSWW